MIHFVFKIEIIMLRKLQSWINKMFSRDRSRAISSAEAGKTPTNARKHICNQASHPTQTLPCARERIRCFLSTVEKKFVQALRKSSIWCFAQCERFFFINTSSCHPFRLIFHSNIHLQTSNQTEDTCLSIKWIILMLTLQWFNGDWWYFPRSQNDQNAERYAIILREKIFLALLLPRSFHKI